MTRFSIPDGPLTDDQIVEMETRLLTSGEKWQRVREMLGLGWWPGRRIIDDRTLFGEARSKRLVELEQFPAVVIFFPFRDEFRDLSEFVVVPACRWENLKPVLIDREGAGTSTASEKARKVMRSAALFVADVSRWNVNVCYEIGFMDALGKPGVLISSKKRARQPHYLKDREVSLMSTGHDGVARSRETLRERLRLLRAGPSVSEEKATLR